MNQTSLNNIPPGEDEDCRDDPNFLDSLRYTCADWGPDVGFNCFEAINDLYSSEEQESLLRSCPKSCKVCGTFNTTQAPTTTISPSWLENCIDDPNFVDRGSFMCADWATEKDYPCSDAELYGFSRDETEEILKRCPAACGMCDPEVPTTTFEPTPAPTEEPTAAPTEAPTDSPTAAPTPAPTETPTEAPTVEPTAAPTEAPTA